MRWKVSAYTAEQALREVRARAGAGCCGMSSRLQKSRWTLLCLVNHCSDDEARCVAAKLFDRKQKQRLQLMASRGGRAATCDGAPPQLPPWRLTASHPPLARACRPAMPRPAVSGRHVSTAIRPEGTPGGIPK